MQDDRGGGANKTGLKRFPCKQVTRCLNLPSQSTSCALQFEVSTLERERRTKGGPGASPDLWSTKDLRLHG